MRLAAVACCLALAAAGAESGADAPPGMRWIAGGEFAMGASDDDTEAREDERPRHRVVVAGFWLDATEVTNAQFAAFVAATGYVTTAERRPTSAELGAQLPPGTPASDSATLLAGALVFSPPRRATGSCACEAGSWWRWTPGADWRHPEGPASSLDGRHDHPVVQVSWDDAVAYATWAGKRLPREAEWEFAARGGLADAPYAWGDEPPDRGPAKANLYQGEFPLQDTADDGYAGTAPVRSYPANGYALFDMAGNVWEWCADWYRVDTYRRDAERGVATDPLGPADSRDPDEPETAKRVVRGGSFLCHGSYCSGYRISARMKTDPRTALANVGFRCVRSR